MLIYSRKHVPASIRALYIVIAVALIGYGALGLWADDLYIFGRRHTGVHFHGKAAWIMYGAMLCCCCSVLVDVAAHYDKRAAIRPYYFIDVVSKGLGWSLFVLALVVNTG